MQYVDKEITKLGYFVRALLKQEIVHIQADKAIDRSAVYQNFSPMKIAASRSLVAASRCSIAFSV